MANPQQPKIILVDHTEMDADQHGSYLKITGTDGATYRIPEKRHTLWDAFKNARRGEPILTTFETYLNNDYIVDAKPIKDEILNRAIVYSIKNSTEAMTEERTRSQCLSYSKDLVVAGVVKLDDIYSRATENYEFIKGATGAEEQKPEA